MHIRRLDHVQLAMPAGREDDARAFYQGILGIPEVAKPPHLAARGGCWFEHGDLKVHLGVEADFSPARKAHPAFIVDDLQNLVQRLRGAGHKVVADQPLEGYDRIYADDPFGNRIELMQPTDDDRTSGEILAPGRRGCRRSDRRRDSFKIAMLPIRDRLPFLAQADIATVLNDVCFRGVKQV